MVLIAGFFSREDGFRICILLEVRTDISASMISSRCTRHNVRNVCMRDGLFFCLYLLLCSHT